MTTEKALFAAICAHPDEDTPRLALADWLDEQGTGPRAAGTSEGGSGVAWGHNGVNADRAGFIRAQVELARLPREDDDREMCARRTRLELESAALFDRNRKTWGKRVNVPRKPLNHIRYGYHFRRGFQEFAFAHVGELLKTGDELFRCHPLSVLHAEGVDDLSLRQFLGWPRGVRSVSLEGEMTPDWSPMFRAAGLEGVASLRLADGTFSRQTTAADGLPDLRHLEVPRLLRAPQRAAHFLSVLPHDRLESLEFGYANWTADELVRLAESEKLANLTRLSVGVQDGNPKELREYTASRVWQRSRTANLVWVRGARAEHLPSVPPSAGLRHVQFNASRNTTLDEIRAIAASPLLGSVTRLGFLGGWEGSDKLDALLASPHLGNLAELDLSFCALNPAGAQQLADSPVSDGLVRLDLRYSKIKGDGVRALLTSPRLRRLRRLALEGNGVRPAVAAELRERFGVGVSV